jgi:hypothetical protein
MNSRQRRKAEAEDHNRKRIEAHVERVRIAQDKIDNPQKYARRSRRSAEKVMPFIALCAAAGISI